MPEVTNVRRTSLSDLTSGGFFIRRVTSPGALVVSGAVKPLARRVLSPSSNKENVPPVWAMRPAPTRRSPLPAWYPRTPLRDITAVVKAAERKSRLRDAAARQNQSSEDSLQSVNPTTPAQTEHCVPQCTPPSQGSLPVVASGPGLTQIAASSSPSDCFLHTPSKPIDPALADIMDKKLSSSIEQIEKIVRRNMKRTPKAAQPSKRAAQRRTLMSMR